MRKKLEVLLLAFICVIGLSSLSVQAIGKKSKIEQTKQEQVSKEETAPALEVENVDFAPYMRELQRKIKSHWYPPKVNERKQVVLLFTIGKDGSILKQKVLTSSGMDAMDESALKALEDSAPFGPLPKGFKGEHIDVQFSLDYNVINTSKY